MIFYRLLSDDVKDRNNIVSVSFTDVDLDAWYGQAVAVLAKLDILNGYADGTFQPNKNITRAEFATVASRFDKLETGSKTFSDVPDTHWAYAAIASAAAKGWVGGYEDGTFRPERAIIRAEVVKLTNAVLDRVCDKAYADANANQLASYVDLTAQHWAYYDLVEAINAHDYHSDGKEETWIGLFQQ